MIEIVLDTETTGLSVNEGHRVVEIGCIELENQIPTKRFFHCLIISKFSKLIILIALKAFLSDFKFLKGPI